MESNTEKVRFKFNFDGCIDDVDVEPGIDTVEIENMPSHPRDFSRELDGL